MDRTTNVRSFAHRADQCDLCSEPHGDWKDRVVGHGKGGVAFFVYTIVNLAEQMKIAAAAFDIVAGLTVGHARHS